MFRERGGSAVFARYAFNELVSFIAGWAIVLDYTILIAVTSLTVPAYLAAFWAPIDKGALEIIVALAVILAVLADNVTGVNARRIRAPDLRHGGRPGAAGNHRRPRDRARPAPAPPERDDPPRRRLQHPGPGVRAADRDRRLHRPGGGRQPLGGGRRQPALAQASCRPRIRGDRPRLRGDLLRRPLGASRPRWRDHPRHDAHQGTGARRRRGVPAPVGGRRAQVPGRRRRRGRPGGGRQLGHARRVPSGLFAGHQPSDPQRPSGACTPDGGLRT